MKIKCPKCKQGVPPAQVNIATDLAFCLQCNEGFKVSESIDLDSVNPNILRSPPSGAWYTKEMGKIVVGASTRSPIAFFLVPFMCVWSGGSLGGIYGSQIIKGEFNLFISLFGIPFLIGSIIFWSMALMAIWGKIEVSIGKESFVFVGIGRLGWTRKFDWHDIKSIREEGVNVRYAGGGQVAIVMEGNTRISFGTGLNEKRRFFVLNVLKHLKEERR